MLAVSFLPVAADAAAALIVFAGPDGALSSGAASADLASGGAITAAAATARFDGETAAIVEVLAPAGLTCRRLLLVGTGAPDKLDALVAERIGGAITARLLTSGETSATVDVTGALAGSLAAHLGNGASLRAWRFDPYRTTLKDKQKPTLTSLTVIGASDDAAAA